MVANLFIRLISFIIFSGMIDQRPKRSKILSSWGRGRSLGRVLNKLLTLSLSSLRICSILCWGVFVSFLKIRLLRSFHTFQMTKPRTRIWALLTISFPEKFFLQFFRVLDMLRLSQSVCLKIVATQSHTFEVKGQRLRRCSIISS